MIFPCTLLLIFLNKYFRHLKEFRCMAIKASPHEQKIIPKDVTVCARHLHSVKRTFVHFLIKITWQSFSCGKNMPVIYFSGDKNLSGDILNLVIFLASLIWWQISTELKTGLNIFILLFRPRGPLGVIHLLVTQHFPKT